MDLVFKSRNLFASIFFAATALGGFQGRVYADSCPSEDFTQFLKAFSATPEGQQRHTAMTVQIQALKRTGRPDRFEPQTTEVVNSDPLVLRMAPITSESTEGVEIDVVDDHHVNVIDKRAGISKIRVFNFARRGGWELAGVEDWSISERDLSVSNSASMSRAENGCFQRAGAYAILGGLEQHRLTAELFEAALENYVCAAASGDPLASLYAASLSLSGMAPQLEAAKVEALFKAAATTLADGAAGLSSFYCYGNSVEANSVCQHPEQAEKELVRAASMGSVDAINQLGYVLETGELVTHDLDRAVACYRLAADKGNQTAAANFKRLGANPTENTEAACFSSSPAGFKSFTLKSHAPQSISGDCLGNKSKLKLESGRVVIVQDSGERYQLDVEPLGEDLSAYIGSVYGSCVIAVKYAENPVNESFGLFVYNERRDRYVASQVKTVTNPEFTQARILSNYHDGPTAHNAILCYSKAQKDYYLCEKREQFSELLERRIACNEASCTEPEIVWESTMMPVKASVSAGKVHLSDRFGEAGFIERKAYLLQGDRVTLSDFYRNGDGLYYKISYAGKTVTKGWIPSESVRPDK